MRSLSMTVFNAEPSNKYTEALENENYAMKFTFWFPETVKPVTATKVAAKGHESTDNMIYMC
jgi:hypothetical protein